MLTIDPGHLVEVEKAVQVSTGKRGPSVEEIEDLSRYDCVRDETFVKAEEDGKKVLAALEVDYLQKLERAQRPKRPTTGAKKRSVKASATCDCPVEHHARPRKSDNPAKQREESHDGGPMTDEGTPLAGLPEIPESERNTAPAQPEQASGLIESIAKKCHQCSKYKRPPRGKKLA